MRTAVSGIADLLIGMGACREIVSYYILCFAWVIADLDLKAAVHFLPF